MVRSMTGFGLGSSETGRFAVRAEVRSVNNRNLRVTLRLPERLQALEPEFEKMLREAMSRGTVTAAVTVDDVSGDPGYVLDTAAIEFYRDALKKIEKGKVPLAVLIALPGAVRKKPAEEIPDELAAAAREAMQRADQAARRRARGGRRVHLEGHDGALPRDRRARRARRGAHPAHDRGVPPAALRAARETPQRNRHDDHRRRTSARKWRSSPTAPTSPRRSPGCAATWR